MIGNAYSDLEWYEDAITAYRMTMDIAAANDEPNAGASAAFNLGNMYFRLEMWAEAVEAYAEALCWTPTMPMPSTGASNPSFVWLKNRRSFCPRRVGVTNFKYLFVVGAPRWYHLVASVAPFASRCDRRSRVAFLCDVWSGLA